ncbi:hypothetical protein ACQKM2_35775 [Streptomyces sp. NPDC004126]|uniref:hypothetical protein n=1 Tax=Streptomyces sp. NPDC004126 TaxID=3390695 RepID=UPI003D03B677
MARGRPGGSAAHRRRPHPDEELRDEEGQDGLRGYRVLAGAHGTVVAVRQYLTPFPYLVYFDRGTELALGEDALYGIGRNA